MAQVHVVNGLVSETLVIDNVDPSYPHHEVGLAFFSDASRETPVLTGLTGTFVVEGVLNGNQQYTSFNGSPVDLSVSGSYASAATSCTSVRAVPTGVTGATHYEFTLTSKVH